MSVRLLCRLTDTVCDRPLGRCSRQKGPSLSAAKRGKAFPQFPFKLPHLPQNPPTFYRQIKNGPCLTKTRAVLFYAFFHPRLLLCFLPEDAGLLRAFNDYTGQTPVKSILFSYRGTVTAGQASVSPSCFILQRKARWGGVGVWGRGTPLARAEGFPSPRKTTNASTPPLSQPSPETRGSGRTDGSRSRAAGLRRRRSGAAPAVLP